MKQIIEHIWHVGNYGCSVYAVETGSEDGLVLIDTGIDLDMINRIHLNGRGFKDIRHCILRNKPCQSPNWNRLKQNGKL